MKSWKLITSVGAGGLQWASGALRRGGLRFQVLAGTKVDSVCADLRDGFQIKGRRCPLWETDVCVNHKGQFSVLNMGSTSLSALSHLCCSLYIHASVRCTLGSRHLLLSPSLEPRLSSRLCCAAQQLSSASPPASLLSQLSVSQLWYNPGSQCSFLGNKDNLFWRWVLSS